MTTDYQPIDCNFHDWLLAKATLQERVAIEYSTGSGTAPVKVKAIIQDVFTENKEEFVRLDTGALVRLDRLAEVAGRTPDAGHCSK